jgi:hypothetical protein
VITVSDSAQFSPRFRDRLSDVDRRALFALIADTAEKQETTDTPTICRLVSHELASRRDAARARDDEPAAIRWAAVLNNIVEDTAGFKKYVDGAAKWSAMTPAEKRAATQPTEAQMTELDRLGYSGIVKDRREASAIIERLRGERS